MHPRVTWLLKADMNRDGSYGHLSRACSHCSPWSGWATLSLSVKRSAECSPNPSCSLPFRVRISLISCPPWIPMFQFFDGLPLWLLPVSPRLTDSCYTAYAIFLSSPNVSIPLEVLCTHNFMNWPHSWHISSFWWCVFPCIGHGISVV